MFNKLQFGIKTATKIFQKFDMKIFGDTPSLTICFDDFPIAAYYAHMILYKHDKILQKVIERAKYCKI